MVAKAKAKTETVETVEIQPLTIRTMTFHLLGTTPLIMNRQSEKARRQLLLPPRKLNKAAQEQTQKHDPYEEFRGSAYISSVPNARSYLHMPGGAFKRAIAEAAIDIPGAAKAQIGRLVSLASTQIDIWGLPYLRFDMVRQAGMSKTPDTRFRACLPEWACQISLNFVATIISPQSLANLVDAAGMIRAVGDYRVEKGAGDYGQFRIVPENDPDWQRIVETQGREPQRQAIAEPVPFDGETAEILEWFDAEIERRTVLPRVSVNQMKADAEAVS